MCAVVPSPRPPCIHLYRLTRTPSSGLFLSLARRGLSEKNGGEGDINKGGGGGGGKSTAHTSYRDRRNRRGSWSRKNRTREGDHPSSPRSLGLFGWSVGGQVDRRRGPLSVIHRRASVLWLDPQRRREKMSSRDQIDNDAAMYYVRNIGDSLHPYL